MNSTTLVDKKIAGEQDIVADDLCIECKIDICRRVVVSNLALGYTDSYHCIACLAKEKNQPTQELFNYLIHYIQTRPCYMIMWEKSRCDETRRAGCPYRLSCK